MFKRSFGALAFAASAALAAVATPAAAVSTAATADSTVECGATGVMTGISPDLTAASLCAGIFTVESIGTTVANTDAVVAAVNADTGFAGYDNWISAVTINPVAGQSNVATDNGVTITLTNTNNGGNLTSEDVGLWSISGVADAVDALAILLIADDGQWAVYMVDLASDGRFSSIGAKFGSILTKPPLYSITLLTAAVPVPAAAPLLLTGLLGLGALRRRRAAAA